MVEEPYNFILFISGMSVKSSAAIENIQKICDQHFKKKCKLKIIDISLEKEMAAKYQIFAIPTLLKTSPKPVRRILGDLSDEEKVLKILQIIQ